MIRSKYATASATVAILFFSMIFGQTPAFGQNIPAYNISSYCSKVADAGGGSYSIEEGCHQMEIQAKGEIQTRWNLTPARIRNYCIQVGEAGGGSFSILNGCIDMETGAMNRMK